jgi:AmpD protein
LESTHFDDRPYQCESSERVDLLIIHNISLPPASNRTDFDNQYVEQFFTGQLDSTEHPYFETITQVRVSSHLYVKRDGTVIQFVPLNKRAWHAGVSSFRGRERCNDFSIGIEMQGTDDLPFEDAQYESLVRITKQIQLLFPLISVDKIVGHEHIAPVRKTDPGRCFDWYKYINEIA